MRLIPHIRTRRWIWLGPAVGFAIVWVGSAHYAVFYMANSRPIRAIGIIKGCVVLTWRSHGGQIDSIAGDGWDFKENGWGLVLLPSFTTKRSAPWGVWHGAEIPLWPPTLLFSAAAIFAFRRARGPHSPGGCNKCSYPRAGLPEASPCPECGKT